MNTKKPDYQNFVDEIHFVKQYGPFRKNKKILDLKKTNLFFGNNGVGKTIISRLIKNLKTQKTSNSEDKIISLLKKKKPIDHQQFQNIFVFNSQYFNNIFFKTSTWPPYRDHRDIKINSSLTFQTKDNSKINEQIQQIQNKILDFLNKDNALPTDLIKRVSTNNSFFEYFNWHIFNLKISEIEKNLKKLFINSPHIKSFFEILLSNFRNFEKHFTNKFDFFLPRFRTKKKFSLRLTHFLFEQFTNFKQNNSNILNLIKQTGIDFSDELEKEIIKFYYLNNKQPIKHKIVKIVLFDEKIITFKNNLVANLTKFAKKKQELKFSIEKIIQNPSSNIKELKKQISQYWKYENKNFSKDFKNILKHRQIIIKKVLKNKNEVNNLLTEVAKFINISANEYQKIWDAFDTYIKCIENYFFNLENYFFNLKQNNNSKNQLIKNKIIKIEEKFTSNFFNQKIESLICKVIKKNNGLLAKNKLSYQIEKTYKQIIHKTFLKNYFEFHSLFQKYENATNDFKTIKNQIKEINRLRTQFKPNQEIINSVNDYLDFFQLDFKLKRVKSKFVQHQYSIHKTNEKKSADIKFKYLSEGEKNILIFLYFIAEYKNTITKQDDDWSSYLIVIDDPISSLTQENSYLLMEILIDFIKKNQYAQFILLSHKEYFINNLMRNIPASKKNCFYRITKKPSNLKTQHMISNVEKIDYEYFSIYHEYWHLFIKTHKSKKTHKILILPHIMRSILEIFSAYWTKTKAWKSFLEKKFKTIFKYKKQYDCLLQLGHWNHNDKINSGESETRKYSIKEQAKAFNLFFKKEYSEHYNNMKQLTKPKKSKK